MRRINMEMYLLNPNQYELRTGSETGAPLCPYGNHYEWIGYDKSANEYIRFTKSVFKLIINRISKIGLGGSCHWCTEAIFQSLKGVEKVEQGWISSAEEPAMSEAIIVHFKTSEISLETLIDIHLNTHSCTSNHSMRKKYRSAVYIFNSEQAKEANDILVRLSTNFEQSLVTKVYTFEEFKLNEEQYLDYYHSNPNKPFCENVINPKMRLLLSKFSKNVNKEKVKHLD